LIILQKKTPEALLLCFRTFRPSKQENSLFFRARALKNSGLLQI